eukprot:scaffold16687_cov102-Skeletonema_dohrnii-CCMP3373.AAC.1
MEVEGSPNFEPTPDTGDEANLVFTLVSVRTWGITECVAPIVHAPNKWGYLSSRCRITSKRLNVLNGPSTSDSA